MSEVIWELIKKMNVSEKSFFKKQYNTRSKVTDPIYLKMFDTFNSQPIYNEKELKKIYGSANLVSRMKNYLYEILLEAIVNYSYITDSYSKSKKQLGSAKVLFQKGMLNQAKKQLNKTIRTAIENIDFYSELEAWSYLRKIYQFELNQEKVQYIAAEERRLFLVLEEINDFELLHFEISKISNDLENKTSQETVTEYDNIISNQRLQSVKNCSSIIATSYFYRIKTIFYEKIGDLPNFYKNAFMRYETLVKTNYFQIDVLEHINTLNNLIESCLVNDKLKDANYYNDFLFKIKSDSLYLDTRKKVRYLLLTLHIQLASNERVDMRDTDNLVKDILKTPDVLMRKDEQIEILTLVIILYFNQRKFKEARFYISEFNKRPRTKERLDLQIYIRIITHYIYYMLNELEHLKYLMRKDESFFKNVKTLGKFETGLITFLKKEVEQNKPNTNLQKNLIHLQDEIIVDTRVLDYYSICRYVNFDIK